MGITQADIDALLTAAQDLSEEAGGAPTEPSPPPPAASGPRRTNGSAGRPKLRRILNLSVPVIVTLAEQQMPVKKILDIKVGSIIEFDRPFDAELELIVSNCRIATGQAVKVGENFGLRITQIGNLDDTIKALGQPD